jgi:hypothetical protein
VIFNGTPMRTNIFALNVSLLKKVIVISSTQERASLGPTQSFIDLKRTIAKAVLLKQQCFPNTLHRKLLEAFMKVPVMLRALLFRKKNI